MRYRTKVTVITGGKEYAQGSILPANISHTDLAFLKSKDFVTPADIATSACEESENYFESDAENGRFSGFSEMEPDALKSPEEILKIRSKRDVFQYADAIGLDLGENYEERSLKDLQEEVINFQEEKLEEET